MDPNGDEWWWTIMEYEWPINGDDNDVVDEENDDHDFFDDLLINVDVYDDNFNNDDDAIYDVLDVDIELSSKTFEWP